MNYADRVQETTTTAGTGAVSMAGAVAGYRALSASGIATGTQIAYCLIDGTAWETAYGTAVTGTPWTVSRDILIASSTGAFLNLSGGATVFFLTAPAPQIDWPTVAETVAAGETLNIPAGRRLTTSVDLAVLGACSCLGDLSIL